MSNVTHQLFPGFRDVLVPVATGQSIAAVVGGTGPALLLLHGHPQTHVIWHRVATQLAEHFTVVAADLRGYGYSSKPVGDADHANYAKRVMAQDQMALLETEIREAMVYGAHKEMGALYSKVFDMRDVIKVEQDRARKKLDGESWLRKEKERLLQERQTYLVLTFLFLLYLWVLLAVLSRIGNN